MGREHPQPICALCGREIVGLVEGAFGSWKHRSTNRELGDDGHVARPITVQEFDRRASNKARNGRDRSHQPRRMADLAGSPVPSITDAYLAAMQRAKARAS